MINDIEKMTPEDRDKLNYAVGLIMGIFEKYGEIDVLIYYESIRVRIDRVRNPANDGP